MARIKALGRDSHLNVIKLVSELDEMIPLPAGVTLRDESEMVIWKQLTGARTREGWREFDLLTLSKAVYLEADIRKYRLALDKSGPIVKNERGTQIVNPFIALLDSLTRLQLAIQRTLSLNQTYQDPRTLNSQGLEQSQLRAGHDDFDDLIAR